MVSSRSVGIQLHCWAQNSLWLVQAREAILVLLWLEAALCRVLAWFEVSLHDCRLAAAILKFRSVLGDGISLTRWIVNFPPIAPTRICPISTSLHPNTEYVYRHCATRKFRNRPKISELSGAHLHPRRNRKLVSNLHVKGAYVLEARAVSRAPPFVTSRGAP